MSRASSKKGPPGKGGAKAAAKPARPARGLPPGWFVIGGLAIATLILFRDVMMLGQVFLSPDSAAPLGFVRVGEESLRHGVYPLWNPYIFCGMPSFASLAYNPFIYPPDLPVWLVTHLLPLPSTTWLVLYYFLAGVGAYLLCREWGMGRAAASFAGLAFLSMPNLVAAGAYGHGSQLMDSAYIPWVLWLAARVFRTGKLTDIAWLALTLGFQMLRGHVQICYYTWLALGLYVVIEAARGGADRPEPRTRLVRAGGVVLALGIGLALSAFLYLPVHDYVQYSIRGGNENGGVGMDYATQWSFGKIELLTFFVPGAVGFGGPTYWGSMPFTDYPEYMGLGVLLLALVGAVRARHPRTLLYLALLSVFALLVSFGHNGFFYQLLYSRLPYFNKFRIPVMILILLQLAVAVLAAEGVDAVLEARAVPPRESARTRRALTLAIAVAGLVFVLGVMPDLWRETLTKTAMTSHPQMAPNNLQQALAGAAGDAIRVGILASLALGAAWLALRRTIPAAMFVAAALLFTAIDLWIVDQELMAPVLGPPQVLAQTNERDEFVDFLSPVADTARAHGQEIRVLALGQDFQSNRFAGFGIPSLTGYHAAKPKLADQFVAAIRDSLQQGSLPPRGFLGAAGVDFWVVPGQLGGKLPYLRPVFRGQQGLVYQDSSAMMRARLATRYEVLPYDQQLRKMMQITYDPSGPILLAQAPPGPLGPPGGTVRITRYDLNQVDMEADCPGPAILRFSDLYFPDWNAYVDGQGTPVWRADFCFRALPLAAGHHRVEWKYEPRALTEGLWISILALLGVGALFGVSAWRSRRPPAGR
jgi:hypothetical protein